MIEFEIQHLVNKSLTHQSNATADRIFSSNFIKTSVNTIQWLMYLDNRGGDPGSNPLSVINGELGPIIISEPTLGRVCM